MADRDELECMACGWQGEKGELVCSEEDGNSDTSLDLVAFNACPQCGEAEKYDESLDEEED